MIENKIDIERTRQAYHTGEFQDKKARSYYSIAGHIFLRGIDRENQRVLVFAGSKMICAICGERVRFPDADYDHIVGGSPVRRCDCLCTKLANGSLHTNVQLVHGMFSRKACHQKKHHRI